MRGLTCGAAEGKEGAGKSARRSGWLSGNALKIIALVAMTVDHLGLIVFDNNVVMRAIGRIAFPIFAYMIAEGCRYTRSKIKYFLLVCGLGVLCQIFYYAAYRSLELNILLTFSFSVAAIFALDCLRGAVAKKEVAEAVFFALAFAGVLVLAFLPNNSAFAAFIGARGLRIDYGFCGVLLPVLISLSGGKYIKLALTALGMVFLSLTLPDMGSLQWFCFLALIPLALYDGTRGKLHIKYLFYIYYPAHLVVIAGIGLLVGAL